MSERIINLEVNESGAWKRVTSFPMTWFEDGDLESCADSLLELSANTKLKARLIVPGNTAPIMCWKHGDGWREWRATE